MMAEDRTFDDFFLSLSGSDHIELIRSVVWGLQILGALGFLYYWVRAMSTALIDTWRLHKSSQGIFEFNKFSNPGTQRFLKFLLKGMLVWLLGGWPLVLLAAGLVSEDTLNAFHGYRALFSG